MPRLNRVCWLVRGQAACGQAQRNSEDDAEPDEPADISEDGAERFPSPQAQSQTMLASPLVVAVRSAGRDRTSWGRGGRCGAVLSPFFVLGQGRRHN